MANLSPGEPASSPILQLVSQATGAVSEERKLEWQEGSDSGRRWKRTSDSGPDSDSLSALSRLQSTLSTHQATGLTSVLRPS